VLLYPEEGKEDIVTASNRRIEVFTAGCPICNETLRLVQSAVKSCGCEVIERRCAGDQQCEEAKRYGVRAMPSVVVDGEIVFEGRITPAQAALLTQ
jgi:glutaredoxin